MRAPSEFECTDLLCRSESQFKRPVGAALASRTVRPAGPTGGSSWTKKYPPRKVVFVKYQSVTADERAYTLALMHACGDWRRVRGAQWSKVDLRGPPPQLNDVSKYAYAIPDVSRIAIPSQIATTGRGWRRVSK